MHRSDSVFRGTASGGKVDAKEKNGKIGPLLEFFRGKVIIDRNAPRRSETPTRPGWASRRFSNEKTSSRRKKIFVRNFDKKEKPQ